ncbi:two-component sensor histidine kinase [Desulfocucumis palustris]|uniref:histidine kinase n=1 Tax=Desulfocucumis palustris TaxID=1898651 RepID=A0A2L2XFE3_9FIRM|nr:HAMP domain-containing sensor histidine kinase [Desulfocucumis palustris]GBF34880.1 two-component sensor histidine kinase [Desulfocucumis palustris]
MDTKLKNIKYSTGTKITAFIIAWLCLISIAGSGLYLIFNQEVINSKSYFQSSGFKYEFDRLVYDVVKLNSNLKSEEDVKNTGNGEYTDKDNLDRINTIQKRFSNTVNFAYCIRNSQKGETITNVTAEDPVALLQKQPTVEYFNQWTSDWEHPLDEEIKQLLSGTPYEIYAAVIEPLKQGDVFYDGFTAYNKTKTISTYVIFLMIASIILMILSFIYLVWATGHREQGGEIVLSLVDRIYPDVHSLMVFIAAIISLAIVSNITFHNSVELFIVFLVFGIDVLIGLSYILSMIRQIKSGLIIKNTLIYKIFYLCFNGRTFKPWTLLLLLAYGAVNGILFMIAFSGDFSLFLISVFLIAAFNIAAIYFAARSLSSLWQIMEAVKEISTGNVDYALNISQISAAFSGFAGDIQSIQGGLKRAVAEAVKGERMKADLITNVSHDLKTPLTSIVNYVDLLKKEHLNNENAVNYVCVLEEKSARLKQLIEDLIEASKASSGNLAVRAEKIDLHELVMQACGEYQEKFTEAELDIHVNADDKKTLIFADGKHMWRIVENLLSNVLKYSMPRSRVYIAITRNDPYGMLIIKNISSIPLDISPEQLTERFVRGDSSRTTEGSGLGLSIAESLTNLQGGRFNVKIDGDLFKVMVEIPLFLEGRE